MVNQRFAFALHIMTVLAFRRRLTDSGSLALSLNTNPVVVRRLVVALRRANLVETFTGRIGGTRLARRPNQITLLQIYRAIDPRPAVDVSHRRVFRGCPVSCSITPVMQNVASTVQRSIERRLHNISLEQIVRRLPHRRRQVSPRLVRRLRYP